MLVDNVGQMLVVSKDIRDKTIPDINWTNFGLRTKVGQPTAAVPHINGSSLVGKLISGSATYVKWTRQILINKSIAPTQSTCPHCHS